MLDRGFIFGDGVYEVVLVYARRLFRFDEHTARLSRNLAKLRIANPGHSAVEWLAHCRTLVAAQPVEDQPVYIQVTRGVVLRDHVMPGGHRAHRVHDDERDEAADGRTATPRRGLRDGARFPPGSAATSSRSAVGNVLARQISADAGAVGDDHVPRRLPTEASASNV